MFRRSKPDSSATTTDDATGAAAETATPGAHTSGKGRPTPTRKEAEAAAKARAKVPRTRKELAAAQRAARTESGQKTRQAMRSGDERYLPARDRGPVRRFIRDYVDSRLSFIELMVPIMLVTLALGWSGRPSLVAAGNMILIGTLIMIVFEVVFLRLRLRKELARRFPGESTKGATYYAVMRALQMKFMRLPKSQVKLGQELPEHYR